jgi:HK97 gp10 family phage protein
MATGQIFDLTVEGEDELVRNIERIAQALEAIAPSAIETAAKPALQLMQRLVPVRTGKLKATIRYSSGTGSAKTATRRSGALGKTRVVGYLLAGDETTLVGGSRASTRKGKEGRQWQLARLIEFGTTSMAAQPFFYPAWRASKRKVKADIAKEMRRAFKRLNAAPSQAAA